MTLSSRILRGVSILIFVFSFLAFLFANVASFAPQKVKVWNGKNEVIGEASIPRDGRYHLLLALTILSGIQLWTIQLVGRRLSQTASPKN